ncbi:hypothetical protein NDU88_003128 [Pleurodeles waltl]|uniref:Uncharacterized protein n=1 Tax=Pleurodeles waltl TaxID=8319 RepID=A0AAV7PAE1_PLEWA|nr:hypothetical protein NDU88_003128 [Pleurodeles waltl]
MVRALRSNTSTAGSGLPFLGAPETPQRPGNRIVPVPDSPFGTDFSRTLSALSLPPFRTTYGEFGFLLPRTILAPQSVPSASGSPRRAGLSPHTMRALPPSCVAGTRSSGLKPDPSSQEGEGVDRTAGRRRRADTGRLGAQGHRSDKRKSAGWVGSSSSAVGRDRSAEGTSTE